MDRSEDIKRLAVEWAEKKGREKAIVALVKIGFSISASEKILGGRYGHELRPQKAESLTKLLRKDGFTLTGEKAS